MRKSRFCSAPRADLCHCFRHARHKISLASAHARVRQFGNPRAIRPLFATPAKARRALINDWRDTVAPIIAPRNPRATFTATLAADEMQRRKDFRDHRTRWQNAVRLWIGSPLQIASRKRIISEDIVTQHVDLLIDLEQRLHLWSHRRFTRRNAKSLSLANLLPLEITWRVF
jgi:hypothetical protein